MYLEYGHHDVDDHHGRQGNGQESVLPIICFDFGHDRGKDKSEDNDNQSSHESRKRFDFVANKRVQE